LIATILSEPMTPRTRTWIAQDAAVTVWTLTRVELLSALARRRRERRTAPDILATARHQLLTAWEQWTEITAFDLVRPRAGRLVERHPLRAADALQIAAALVASDDDSSTLEFVTLDRILADAAAAEGFRVLGPSGKSATRGITRTGTRAARFLTARSSRRNAAKSTPAYWATSSETTSSAL